MPISAEKLQRYRRAAHSRWQAERRQQEARRALAWNLARQAAALTISTASATSVVVFGSLRHPGRFTLQSHGG